MPEARLGKGIHAGMEALLRGAAKEEAFEVGRKGLVTEREFKVFDRLWDGVVDFKGRIAKFRSRHRVQRQLVEYALAITEELTPTQFYSKNAFFRGIFDVAYIFDNKMAMVDHKSGARIGTRVVREQIESYAVLALQHFRQIQHFWLGVYWVADREMEWVTRAKAAEINQVFLPRVMDNIEAAALAVDDGARPNPTTWCEVCGYRSLCPAGQDFIFEPVEEERYNLDD